jgi:hypothetical protein
MFCALALNWQKTFRTSEFRAQFALVLGRQHSATAVVLALHDEFARTFGGGSVVHFSANAVSFLVQFSNYRIVFTNCFHDFRDFQITLGFVSVAEGAFIILGDTCDRAICENEFAMVFVVIVHENRVQRRFRKFEAPFVSAIHAMGIRSDAG